MNGLPRERAPDPASVPADSPDPTTGDRHEDDIPCDPGGADWTGLADAAWLAAARLDARRTHGPAPDHPSDAGRQPGAPGPDTSRPGQPSPTGPPPAGGPDPLPGPVPGTPSGPAPGVFDLVLLVDRAPTMPPWGATVRQIADEASRSGAFRDVRTIGVTLPAGAGEPALRWPGGRDGDPAELIDGRGSRLFLVVTDGLAHGWAGHGADRLLERLASGGPTALVHLLPPYLRHRTSLFPFRAQLDAGGFGAPNRRFRLRPPLGAHDPVRPLPEPDDGTVPVPVLSVRAGSFGAWADLVTGEPGVRRTLPVVLAGAMAKAASAPGLRTPVVDGPRAAAAAVRRFRSLASPLARQLAVLLALAPMDFAVIDELCDLALPDAGPEHLAEVMMGGLIDWDTGAEGGPDFADDIREALLATSTRTQLARTVGLLAELRSGQGHGARLRAALHDPVRTALPGAEPGARPWLRIELAVLRALAGPYAGRAARVATRLVGSSGGPSARPGEIGAEPMKKSPELEEL